MERQKVSSSNIKSIGYDKSNQILEVEFKGSGVYQYYSVPEQVYISFLGVGSKGAYLSKNITNRYRYKKVGQ